MQFKAYWLSVLLLVLVGCGGGDSTSDNSRDEGSDTTPVDDTPGDTGDDTTNPDDGLGSVVGGFVPNLSNGKTLWESDMCQDCHTVDGTEKELPRLFNDERYYSGADDVFQITEDTMPKNLAGHNVGDCVGQCAADIAAYLWDLLVINGTEVPVDVYQPLACDDSIKYGRQQLKLLTKTEYLNSIQALTGIDASPYAALIPNDNLIGHFPSQTQALVSKDRYDAYFNVSERIATAAAANVVNCTGLDNTACADALFNDFGLRAFRRPMTEEEKTAYRVLFDGEPIDGVIAAVQGMLSSPQFLYRSEIGISQAEYENLTPPEEARADDQYEPDGEVQVLTLGDFDGGATLEGNEHVLPLYAGSGTSSFNFTGDDLIQIVVRGQEGGGTPGVSPQMRIQVDNQEIAAEQITARSPRNYKFHVTGIQGQRYFRIENQNAAAHDPDRKLYFSTISISKARIAEVAPPEITDPIDADAFVLTPYEMATFLSYTFAGIPPDDQLMSAARLNQLDTDEQIYAQIDRLLALPEAEKHLGEFASLWLDTDKVTGLDKDAEIHATFNSQVAQAMTEEVKAIFNYVVLENRPFSELYSADYTFANQELAAFYGLEAVAGDELQQVAAPARGGLLMTGAFLAGNAEFQESSPIRRAVRIRERMLCHHIDPPPDNLDDDRAAAEEENQERLEQPITQRERTHLLTNVGSCAKCHEQKINPLGFGLENVNAVGLFRGEDFKGNTIDASGVLYGLDLITDANEIAFNGAKEIAEILGEADAAKRCFATETFRSMIGLLPSKSYFEGDVEVGTEELKGYACSVQKMVEDMGVAQDSPKALLRALGTLDVIRYRKARDQ